MNHLFAKNSKTIYCIVIAFVLSSFTLPFYLIDRIESLIPNYYFEDSQPKTFHSITWSTAASQPFSVSESQGVVVNGKFYNFGGFDSQKSSSTPTSRAYVFDPETNIWTRIADMPPMNGTVHGGVTHSGFATDGQDVFFAGGYTSNSTGRGQIFGTREAWKYILGENRYVRLPDLPIVISAGQLAYVNGKLHHIAGTNPSRTVDLGNHYVLDLNNLPAGWQTAASLPNPRQHAGSAVLGGLIYYIGGQNGHDGNLSTRRFVHRYDPTMDTWTRMADLIVPQNANGLGHISSSVLVFGNKIVVLGGEVSHSSPVNMVSSYDPATDSWIVLTPLPQARRSGTAGVIGNFIYYSGGQSSATYKGMPIVEPEDCTSFSNLACIQLEVQLPFSLNFNQNVTSSLIDKNGTGTGFTMVKDYSGIRHPDDGAPNNPLIRAFQPSKLTITAGKLNLETNKGISHLTANNQINALGVKFDSKNKFHVEVVIENPFNGNSSQQAGIWIGHNDNSYLKLNVNGNKLELRSEINNFSPTSSIRVTPVINGLENQILTLRIVVDPEKKEVEGFYAINSGDFINVGQSYPTPPLNISNLGITEKYAYAGIFATHRNANSPVSYSFDNFKIWGNEPGSEILLEPCPPLSPLPCNQIAVELPYLLDFSGSKPNTLEDKNGFGTGFTMIDPYSGIRLPLDGSPSNLEFPSFEPSKLTVINGQIQFISNKGIAHTTNNNQINTIGVKFGSSEKFTIETDIIQPFNGTSAQQAGIWIGLNDKTFLKLIINSNRIEFRREINDVTTTADQRITSVINNLNQEEVTLRLLVDPTMRNAEAFYSINGGDFLSVGANYPVKGLALESLQLTNDFAYAGIFSTHRNSLTPVTYSFDDFRIYKDNQIVQITSSLENQASKIDRTKTETIKEIEKPTLNIYPNPSKGKSFHIQVDNLESSELIEIQLMDIFGKSVFNKTGETDESGGFKTEIIYERPSGKQVYIILVQTKSNIIKSRVLLE